MAIDTTASFVTSPRLGNVQIFRFTHPTIPLGTNQVDIALSVPRKGSVLGMKVYCPTSTAFTVTLAGKDGQAGVGNDIIIPTSSSNNVKYNVMQSIPIPYFNNEATQMSRLFLSINNTDGANPTGIVVIDLMIQFPE